MARGISSLREYFEMNSSRLISIIYPCFRGHFEEIDQAHQGSSPSKIVMSILDQSSSINEEEIEYSDIFLMFLVVVR